MYKRLSILLALVMTCMIGGLQAQTIERTDDDSYDLQDYQDGVDGRGRIDRYLDVEVWTDQRDGDYYEGDNITMNFRTNRDAFVAIYAVDTRGRVNLLFPSTPYEDNFVSGDQTYRLPGSNADYDLIVNGPSGREYIQIVASRERFPIPNWYGNSGKVLDGDIEYAMDDINDQDFVRYSGQRFAYDRAVIFVNDWEPEYFRPVYYPSYPSWSSCGNVYIDYPWGGSVYINGIYWGCAPLYIPRILVGWQTVTVYDPYGYCWERDVHITHYNTIVLNRTVIRPERHIVSKYKEVRAVGYRDPVKNGYPKYKETITRIESKAGIKSSTKQHVTVDRFTPDAGKSRAEAPESVSLTKKYVRGSAKVTQSERGIETIGGDRSGYSERQAKARKSRETTATGVDNRDKTGSGSTTTGPSYEPYRSSKRSIESTNSGGKVEGRGSDRSQSGSKSGGPASKRTKSDQSAVEQSTQSTPPPSSSGKSGDSGKGNRVGSQKVVKQAPEATQSDKGKGSSSSDKGKSGDSGNKSRSSEPKGKGR